MLEESIVVVDLDVHDAGVEHCETTKHMFTPQHEVVRVEGDEVELAHVAMQDGLPPLQEVNQNWVEGRAHVKVDQVVSTLHKSTILVAYSK